MVSIEDIHLNATGCRPVVVDFQNSKVQLGKQHNLEANLLKFKDETIVSVKTHDMLYTGEVNDDENYYNFILIHNKNHEKVRLVQVDHSTVSPKLSKQNFNSSSVLSSTSTSLSDLNKQFGSKTTKRLTEQRERLTMNIDVIKDTLEKSVSDIKMSESPMDQATDENTSIYRPKINRDASTRDDVYNLEDLVPYNILGTLETEARNIIITGDVSNFRNFVSSSLNSILRSNASEEAMIKKICMFLYIEYLLKFFNTPMKNVTKKFVLCDKSAEVNKHIMDTFTVSGQNGRTRPVHMKDKSLCYIVILTAKAMDYEVDIASLAKDCKIGVKKALEISRILAFNTSAKNKNVVTLKLPLPEPVIVAHKRRK